MAAERFLQRSRTYSRSSSPSSSSSPSWESLVFAGFMEARPGSGRTGGRLSTWAAFPGVVSSVLHVESSTSTGTGIVAGTGPRRGVMVDAPIRSARERGLGICSACLPVAGAGFCFGIGSLPCDQHDDDLPVDSESGGDACDPVDDRSSSSASVLSAYVGTSTVGCVDGSATTMGERPRRRRTRARTGGCRSAIAPIARRVRRVSTRARRRRTP